MVYPTNKPQALSSEVCGKRDQAYRRRLHKKNLRTIKSSIDTSAPKQFKHVKAKYKTKQLQYERNAQIEFDNMKLVGKMKDILANRQVNNIQTVIPRSLNRGKRKQKLTKIVVDNEKMLRRIIQKPPAYDSRQFEEAEEKQRRLLDISCKHDYQDPRVYTEGPRHRFGNYKLRSSSLEGPDETNFVDESPKPPIHSRPFSARTHITHTHKPQRPSTARERGENYTARERGENYSARERGERGERRPICIVENIPTTISGRECVLTAYEHARPHTLSMRAIDVEASLEFNLSLPFLQLRRFFKRFPDLFAGTQISRESMVRKISKHLKFSNDGEAGAQQLLADLSEALELEPQRKYRSVKSSIPRQSKRPHSARTYSPRSPKQPLHPRPSTRASNRGGAQTARRPAPIPELYSNTTTPRSRQVESQEYESDSYYESGGFDEQREDETDERQKMFTKVTALQNTLVYDEEPEDS